MIDTLALLTKLSESHGVSGHEMAPAAIAKAAFEPNADEITVDAMHSVIALRRGDQVSGSADRPRRSIMLAAHSDEIGLMVTGFEGSFIRFCRVGGVDVRTIVGQEVIVHGQRQLPGIIASLPPHVVSAEERTKPIPLDKLFIDIGMPEAKIKSLVRVGDMITMRHQVLELSGGYVSGKAFDDRAGVVAVALCLEHLAGMRHSWDVYGVATSQEEVGLRGALTSSYGIDPTVAIAIDVGFGVQQGVSEQEGTKMDGGPVMAIGPNLHPRMVQKMRETADKYEIPLQTEVVGGRTGTDAWAIQVAREGIPTGLFSLPLRYMHTSVETICLRDIERTARLMALMIASLDEAFCDELAGGKPLEKES